MNSVRAVLHVDLLIIAYVFAEEYYEEMVGAFPNPHNKWDKCWLDNTKDLTLQGLIDVINGDLEAKGAPEGNYWLHLHSKLRS